MRIRIFTPTNEMLFAGHPTLGSAFVLGGPLQVEEIRLETGAGTVPVALEREGDRIVFGRMRQPIPTWKPYDDEASLLAALRVERSELPVEHYDNGMQHVYVALGSRGGGGRAEAGPRALVERSRAARHQLLRRLGDALENPDVRPRAEVWPRIQRLARRPVRSRCTSHATVGSASARRSRSRRAQRSVGHRRSTRAPTASAEKLDVVEVGGSAVIVARGEFRLP